MNRPHLFIWLAFGLCVALAAGAMVAVDRTTRRLERAEAETRALVEREENIQVALWRMDSALATLVAEEGARPYLHYRSFYPVSPNQSDANTHPQRPRDEFLTPSPLLRHASPRVRLYFQFEPDGRLTSPQVPSDRGQHSGDLAARRLEELRQILPRDELAASLEDTVSIFCCPTEVNCCPSDEPIVVVEAIPPSPNQSAQTQQTRGLSDYQKRSDVTRNAQTNKVALNDVPNELPA